MRVHREGQPAHAAVTWRILAKGTKRRVGTDSDLLRTRLDASLMSSAAKGADHYSSDDQPKRFYKAKMRLIKKKRNAKSCPSQGDVMQAEYLWVCAIKSLNHLAVLRISWFSPPWNTSERILTQEQYLLQAKTSSKAFFPCAPPPPVLILSWHLVNFQFAKTFYEIFFFFFFQRRFFFSCYTTLGPVGHNWYVEETISMF